jgi:hypothetical protein
MFLATWLGTDRSVYVLLFVIISGWGVGRPLLEAARFFSPIPLMWSSALVGLCVLLSFLFTRLVLVQSSRVYRSPGVQAELQ